MLRFISLAGMLISGWLIYKFVNALATSKKSLSPAEFIQENIIALRPSEFRRDFEKSMSVLTVTCIILLTLTGFLPVIVFGKAISGVGLILHLIAAPIFAIGLAIKFIFMAEGSKFSKADLKYLQTKLGNKSKRNKVDNRTWSKISFWLLLIAALVVIVSIATTMYPISGTHVQKILISLHGYSALIFIIIFCFHAYLKLTEEK